MGLFDKFKKQEDFELVMPIDGKVIKLEEVEDPVFSQKMMGDGFAVDPINGKVHSPVDGTIATVFPTGHAVGIKVNDSVEVLMHIGLDTVNLAGEGFKVKAVEGDKVKAGDLLVEFEYEEVKGKVPSVVTPVIFTKLDGFKFEVEYKEAKVSEVIGKLNK